MEQQTGIVLNLEAWTEGRMIRLLGLIVEFASINPSNFFY